MPTRPQRLKAERNENRIRYEWAREVQQDSVLAVTPAKKVKHIVENDLEYLMLHTTQEVLDHLHHCVFPAFNISQQPVDDLKELRNYPCCELSLPRPVYVAPQRCKFIDICHKRTKARDLYNRGLCRCRERYQTAHRKNRKLKNMEKDDVYPATLYEFAERLECNPDPFFHGSYDYYYTGGNLCVLPAGEVVHVDGAELTKLNIGVFTEAAGSNISMTPLCSHNFEVGGEIFEVKPLRNQGDDMSSCFAVRQRNSITIHSLHSDGVMKSMTQFKGKWVPFISFAQSPVDINTFVITTMNQKVRIYDLNNCKPTLRESFDINKNKEERVSWNTVQPWQEQTFIYANEREVLLMDTRTTPEDWLQSACTRAASEFECDIISAVLPSEMRKLVYVATNHKLHCLDVRKLGKEFTSDGAVCCWTHQMEYAPAFMDCFRDANIEFIALASARAGDICICELTRERLIAETTAQKVKKWTYKSYTLPYQPPTLKEAYQNARLTGKCLQPDAWLKQRIRSCNTGLAFYESSKLKNETLAMLLYSNSNGDVFEYNISERDSQEYERRPNQLDAQMMCEYAENVCKLTQPDLNHTSVVDLKAMRKVFLCDDLSVPADINEEEALNLPKRRSLGRWQKSLPKLHSYKDALVKNILSAWDIDYCEDKKDIKLLQANSCDIKPKLENLVSSWLEANMVHAVTQPTGNDTLKESFELNASQLMETQTCELNDSIQMGDFSAGLGTQQQSTQLLETTADINFNMEDESFLSKPKPAKKKKYIKGF